MLVRVPPATPPPANPPAAQPEKSKAAIGQEKQKR